jgi:dTDP-4-amino-4,6-dideoxygalactose transaminase
MAGTRLHGEVPGKDADVVVYSFQAVKNLPTADSGMICFREEKYDQICRKLAWLGINKDTYARTNEKGSYKWKYDVEFVGYKDHGNSIMASIGLVQLKYLERDNAYRRQLAIWYNEYLSKQQNVQCIPVAKGCESSRHLFIIAVNNRDELLQILNEHEIYPGVHYRDNTAYDMYAYAKGTCPRSHEMSEMIISLPMHMGVTKKDVEYICGVILKHAK